VSENDNRHCAGTTKVAVKVMGRNAWRGKPLGGPRKTDIEGRNQQSGWSGFNMTIFWIISKIGATRCHILRLNAPISLSDGALPQTTVGELTALSYTLALLKRPASKGIGDMARKEKERWRGEKRRGGRGKPDHSKLSGYVPDTEGADVMCCGRFPIAQC